MNFVFGPHLLLGHVQITYEVKNGPIARPQCILIKLGIGLLMKLNGAKKCLLAHLHFWRNWTQFTSNIKIRKGSWRYKMYSTIFGSDNRGALNIPRTFHFGKKSSQSAREIIQIKNFVDFVIPIFVHLPSISSTFYARGFCTKFWWQKSQSGT